MRACKSILDELSSKGPDEYRPNWGEDTIPETVDVHVDEAPLARRRKTNVDPSVTSQQCKNEVRRLALDNKDTPRWWSRDKMKRPGERKVALDGAQLTVLSEHIQGVGAWVPAGSGTVRAGGRVEGMERGVGA